MHQIQNQMIRELQMESDAIIVIPTGCSWDDALFSHFELIAPQSTNGLNKVAAEATTARVCNLPKMLILMRQSDLDNYKL